MPRRAPQPLWIGTSALGYPLKNARSTSDLADAIFTAGSRTGRSSVG